MALKDHSTKAERMTNAIFRLWVCAA